MNNYPGIHPKAWRLYVSAIEAGVSTVATLSKLSGIKRPTAYLQLQDLIKIGLMEEIVINKKTYFKASDPKVLEKQLDGYKNSLNELSVKFQNNLKNLGKPKTSILEGSNHLNEVYSEIERADSIRIWSNVGEVYPLFNDAYMRLAEMIKEREITTKEIVSDNKKAVRYAKHIKQVSGPTYSCRIANVEGIENDTIVYDNCVVIFRLNEYNLFAVKIEDKTIADTFKAIFDMSWKSAKPTK